MLRPDEVARHTDLTREHPVSAALEPYVERYWTVRWDLTGTAPYRAEVLSAPAVNVCVERGSTRASGSRSRPLWCTAS